MVLLVAGAGARSTRGGERGRPTGTFAIGTGRYVFALRADGTDGHALALGDYPAFSRRGMALTFTRNGIWVANADGSHARHVVPRFAEYLTYASPSFAPDGHRIAYVRVDNGHGTSELWLVDATGARLHGLTIVHFAETPSWSPDGRWIAYAGDGGLSEVRSDGSEKRLLLARPVVSPAWSPDGASIAFQQHTGAVVSTWTLALRTHELRRLERHAGAPGPLAWSPDGRWLAYTTARTGAGGLFVRVHALRVSDGVRAAVAATYVQELDGLSWRR